MVDAVSTRAYDSRLRRARAEATRRCVLGAARELSTAQGYAATSVTESARRPEVSVDTVYASVGRKPQLLLAVHDMILGASQEPVPMEQRDYVRRVRAAGSAQEKLRSYADALAGLLPQTVPLLLALREAMGREPTCRAELRPEGGAARLAAPTVRGPVSRRPDRGLLSGWPYVQDQHIAAPDPVS